MQVSSAVLAGMVGALCVSAEESPRDGSFHPGNLWLDNNAVHINAHGGGILFHEGVYYWFGEHKIAGRRGNSAQVGVHCYSSTDLHNWTDHGIALTVSTNRASEIQRGCVIERPKVIFNDSTGKFVMWFHLELRGQGYSAARTGVAMADHVTGPTSICIPCDRTPGNGPRTSARAFESVLSHRVRWKATR